MDGGCLFVAIREGFSEEVSKSTCKARTKGPGRIRHEKSKRQGDPGHGDSVYKAQHTKNRAAAEEPACRSAQASQTLLPPVSPTCPQPSLASLTRIFLSRQLQMNLGLVITRWSWEDRAAQEPWALWDRPGQRRAVSRGEIGAGGSQSSPPRPRASLRAEPGHSDLSSQSHISLSGRGVSPKNHLVQPSQGPAFHPGVPAGAVQLPPCTSSDELSSGFILSLESASSSSAFQAKEAPSPPPVSLCPGQPNPTPCQSPLV